LGLAPAYIAFLSFDTRELGLGDKARKLFTNLKMNANCEIAQSSLNISFKTLSIYMKEDEDFC
jgi:hypothetical protein